ncbi:MAG: GntR family transcriptional regulator [Anaerolineales bacterium]
MKTSARPIRSRTRLRPRNGERRPLYLKTAQDLSAILRRTEPGRFLPSEPALAQRLGISRATLREAMRSFEEQGVIVRRQGVGTYVARAPRVMEAGLEVLESVETLARKIGLEVEMGELRVEKGSPSVEEAEGLALASGEEVVRVSRVICAQGRPVAYLVDVLPRQWLAPEDLQGAFRGSVLDLLLTRGEPRLAHSRTEISALAAPPDLARRLQIQRGDVLLRLSAMLFRDDGRAVDRSESYFLPGPFRFHVMRKVGRP